ncbi:unnamed protein product, partial [marine sediment metagenome]
MVDILRTLKRVLKESRNIVAWQTDIYTALHNILPSWIKLDEVFLKGTLADRPPPSQAGRIYWATDTDEFFRDTGATWEQVMESVKLKDGNYAGALVGISGTALGRAVYLDQLDFALQEAIAALQTDLDNPAQYKADLTTLETRLSVARAGYLDQLDFNLQEAIAAIPIIMRGTDGAALAANWTVALATILGNFTALRIGYLDNINQAGQWWCFLLEDGKGNRSSRGGHTHGSGSSGSHTHTALSAGSHSHVMNSSDGRPPYYELAPITAGVGGAALAVGVIAVWTGTLANI